jgi:GNAT superfamily N-acetyltransferase
MSLAGNSTELVQGVVRSVLALPSAPTPWGGYLAFIDATVVGTCAFKNAPEKGRPPEVAYFTFPGFERRGIAKAMLAELVRIARAQKITELSAQTRPEPGPSTHVLAHCGFWRRGEGVDDEIGQTWDWSLTLRTQVMGVVNVTPDSFSDGGTFLQADAAISHGKALALAGADVLDIGGESTRPGAQEVSEDEELRRILPVIEGLKGVASEISIDTQKPKVALAALSAGASFVNDVSGLRDSDELARLAARFGARICVMHMQGVPRTMQTNPRYEEVVSEVLIALKQSIARAASAWR